MRKGSWTSSSVSGSSPTLIARVVSPTGPPRNLRISVSRILRSISSSPISSISSRESVSAASARSTVVVPVDLREVAHAPQEAVRDPRRSAGTACDLGGRFLGDGKAEKTGRAADDLLDLLGRVIIDPPEEPESGAQRRGEQSRARRSADQREPLEMEPDRPGARAPVEDDVEPEVLHRRVEVLLDDPVHAMDLVDEEDPPLGQRGQNAGEIPGALEGRAARAPDFGLHLARQQKGECRLS